jgi:[ribosomal protein S5]-alanine N-acetyltransferase
MNPADRMKVPSRTGKDAGAPRRLPCLSEAVQLRFAMGDSSMSSDPQVRLMPATVPLLNALNDDPARFDELIGSPVPDGWPEFPEAIGFTLTQLKNATEADRSWSMQFFVDRATGRLIGSGGFVAPPVERTVEIGYEVAPEFRRRRLGAAAARALIESAVASDEVDHVIAHTLPGPNPSTGVLTSLGFEHVDVQQDPDVGAVWEWRWTRPSPG